MGRDWTNIEKSLQGIDRFVIYGYSYLMGKIIFFWNIFFVETVFVGFMYRFMDKVFHKLEGKGKAIYFTN